MASSAERCPGCRRSGTLATRWDEFLECSSCGLVFWEHYASQATAVESLYDEQYYSGAEYADYAGDEISHRRNFEKRVRVLRRFASGGRLLEIGAAYGFFLDVARAHFDVEGIELSEQNCRYAEERFGVRMTRGEFLAHPVEENAYDVVCLWDTLEHLVAPREYLEKIRRCLRPGGIVCISTGDIGSWNARFRGRKWRLVHPPTHLFYFSRRSLRALLAEVGFAPLYVGTCTNDRTVGSMLRIIANERRQPLAKALLRVLPERVATMSLPLNLFDIMYVVARKAPDGS